MAAPNKKIGHLKVHPVPGDGSCYLHSFNLNVMQGVLAGKVTKATHPELYAWFRDQVLPASHVRIESDLSFKKQLTQLLSSSRDLDGILKNVFMPAMRRYLFESLMNQDVQRSLEAKILPSVRLTQNINDIEQGVLPNENLENKLARQGELSFEDWKTIANETVKRGSYEGTLVALCLEERFGVPTFLVTHSKETDQVNHTNISQHDGAPFYDESGFSLQVRRTGTGVGAHYEPCFSEAEQQNVNQVVRIIQQPPVGLDSYKNTSSRKTSHFFDRAESKNIKPFEEVHKDTIERINGSGLSFVAKEALKNQIEQDFDKAVDLHYALNSPRP